MIYHSISTSIIYDRLREFMMEEITLYQPCLGYLTRKSSTFHHNLDTRLLKTRRNKKMVGKISDMMLKETLRIRY